MAWIKQSWSALGDYNLERPPAGFSAFVTVPKGAKHIHFEIAYGEGSLSIIKQLGEISGDIQSEVLQDVMNGRLPFDSSDPNYMLLIEEETQRRVDADPRAIDLYNQWDGRIYPSGGIVDTIVGFPDLKNGWGTLLNLTGLGVNSAYNNVPISTCLSMCFDHSCSLQVFHTDGTLLTGSPLYQRDWCRGEMYGDSSGPSALGWPAGIDYDKSGQWAEWFSWATAGSIAMATHGNLANIESYCPKKGTILTPSDITSLLKTRHPAVFLPSFQFDDSQVNGNRKVLVKMDDTSFYNLTVDGEQIRWTGDPTADAPLFFPYQMLALGLYPALVDHSSIAPSVATAVAAAMNNMTREKIKSRPFQSLDIEQATEDLIIGTVSCDVGTVYGEWYIDDGTSDPPPWPTEPPEPAPVPVPARCDRPRMWRKRDANENKQHFGL